MKQTTIIAILLICSIITIVCVILGRSEQRKINTGFEQRIIHVESENIRLREIVEEM